MRCLPVLLLFACTPQTNQDTDDVDVSDGCPYPEYAEPMALNQPLAPYAWDQALRIAEDVSQSLDLAQAFCDTDTQFDWSPHDYMLFVSVPAW